MPIESPKRRPTEDIDSTSPGCANPDPTDLTEPLSVHDVDDIVDANSIAAFRSLFELLDKWDQEETKDAK
jgi:hypothetical protein